MPGAQQARTPPAARRPRPRRGRNPVGARCAWRAPARRPPSRDPRSPASGKPRPRAGARRTRPPARPGAAGPQVTGPADGAGGRSCRRPGRAVRSWRTSGSRADRPGHPRRRRRRARRQAQRRVWRRWRQRPAAARSTGARTARAAGPSPRRAQRRRRRRAPRPSRGRARAPHRPARPVLRSARPTLRTSWSRGWRLRAWPEPSSRPSCAARGPAPRRSLARRRPPSRRRPQPLVRRRRMRVRAWVPARGAPPSCGSRAGEAPSRVPARCSRRSWPRDPSPTGSVQRSWCWTCCRASLGVLLCALGRRPHSPAHAGGQSSLARLRGDGSRSRLAARAGGAGARLFALGGRRRRGEPRSAVAASTDIGLGGGVDTLETRTSIAQRPERAPTTRPAPAGSRARRPRRQATSPKVRRPENTSPGTLSPAGCAHVGPPRGNCCR